ncbi:hypothetical protein HN924_01965 [Candidatus Woesearchaeota archaeon]|jgi:hypothetical protein|nr:hypothetical protein [Candidatus Woesearchaeota archaeon]MBT7062714.1 hypothetical protein [Candidatus Woesearchaeota archaeon]MBT7402862.1 hypothetical protein [Candidatus Woesearchaeota archaeon]
MDYRKQFTTDVYRSIFHLIRYIREGKIKAPSSEKLDKNSLKELQEHIYTLYSFDPTFKKCFKDLINCQVKEEYKDYVDQKRTEYKIELTTAMNFMNRFSRMYRNFEFSHRSGWVVLNIKPKIKTTRRFYINCPVKNFQKVILAFLTWIEKYNMKVNIKIADPHRYIIDADLFRCDKIVVYFEEDPRIYELLRDFAGENEHLLKTPNVFFAHPERRGASFGIEPTAEHIKYTKQIIGKERISFGQFISIVISHKLYIVIMDKHRLPTKREAFELAEKIVKDEIEKTHKIKLHYHFDD